jgi:hypothetical protein
MIPTPPLQAASVFHRIRHQGAPDETANSHFNSLFIGRCRDVLVNVESAFGTGFLKGSDSRKELDNTAPARRET